MIVSRGHANRTSPRRNQAIGKESSLNLIDVISPNIPNAALFGEEGIPQQAPRGLETYACYRPDLGYVQGMSYIAALCAYT